MESMPKEHSALETATRATAPPECDDITPAFLLGEAANDTRMSQLARTIEQEIIPRLMLAHRAQAEAAARPAQAGQPIGPDDVRHFAKIVLSQDEDLAFSSIHAFRARGVSIE